MSTLLREGQRTDKETRHKESKKKVPTSNKLLMRWRGPYKIV